MLYEVKLQDSLAFKSLTAACQFTKKKLTLCVYDNSSVAQVPPVDTNWNIHYVHDPTNPGVSRAYNQAYNYSKILRLEWLLLADQDTVFPEDIFSTYEAAARRYTDHSLFAPTLLDNRGIISPYKLGKTSGKRLKGIEPGQKVLSELNAVNSGLLILGRVFEQTGGYSEQLPLDFSDVDFFQRLKKNIPFMIVVDATCRHQLSSSEKQTLASALSRFRIYLHGARVMAREERSGFRYFSRAAMRSIKLSFQYGSPRFIGTLLSR